MKKEAPSEREFPKLKWAMAGLCLGGFLLGLFGYGWLLPTSVHGGDSLEKAILRPFPAEEVIRAVTEHKLLDMRVGQQRSAAVFPAVLAPGMGDSCFNPGFSQITTLVAERTQKKAYCIGPGEDVVTDSINSFIKTMDEQVEHFRDKVRSNPDLAKGFNAIGLSQGNLVIRAYIQKYNDPPVQTFLSIHGPHAGVASIPRCAPGKRALFGGICSLLDQVLGDFVYIPTIQSAIAQSNYFRNPFRINYYLEGCSFLPGILDRATSDQGSKLSSIAKLVLVMANRDTMIFPKETAVFGFFKDNSYDVIVPPAEQPWFKTLKLDEMLDKGKLVVDTTDGDHLRFSINQLYGWVDQHFV